MKKNLILMTAFLIVSIFGTACQTSNSTETTAAGKSADNASTKPAADAAASKPADAAAASEKEKPAAEKKKGIVSIDDKADMTVQPEELVKAKKEAKSPITPPDKYKAKIIEITGRVSNLSPEKNGSLPPRVQLKGGRPIIDDVACEFDEENKVEITTLKKDQMVTLKGLVPDMWLMSPTLAHCIIVEAK
jgi:hypothetical protein